MNKFLPILIIFLLCVSLCACAESIPTPSDLISIPGYESGTVPPPSASQTPGATVSPVTEPSAQLSIPEATPHNNYRQKWEDAGGIPSDVPQLAYGVSEIAYPNQTSVILRWSIINDADIYWVCQKIEAWAERSMQYSEGTDSKGRPTRIWKNDTPKYFLQFTVSERDEPYPDDGSILRGELMISTLG